MVYRGQLRAAEAHQAAVERRGQVTYLRQRILELLLYRRETWEIFRFG
jgi:hypothetical protein